MDVVVEGEWFGVELGGEVFGAEGDGGEAAGAVGDVEVEAGEIGRFWVL